MELPNIDFKPKLNPLLASLPEFVRNPANYEKIQKALIKTVRSCKKPHSEIAEMALCKKCTENMLKRRKLLKDLGFVHPGQYLAWQKIQREIIARFPNIIFTA